MAKKLVTDLNVAGKKVIVRVDFNVPHKGDVITDDNRVVAALPTIKYLLENNAKVILLSHLGKIDYKKSEEEIEAAKKKNDMAIVAKCLQAHLPDNKVIFVDATRGVALEEAIANMKEGEVVLMQNTRYEKGESKNDEELGKYWASLGDLFVEDAFGSVHRAHASTVGIPTHLPSAAGFLVEKELKFLGDAVENPVRPFVGILGGAKVADKLKVIDNLLEKCDTLIIGGGMAYTFLKAQGMEVGESLVDDEKVEYCGQMLEKAKTLNKELLLPVDTVVADNFPDPIDGPIETEVVDSDKIPADKQGLDIGPKTAELFAKKVKEAKTVVWNGPMGVFENPTLAKGTNEVAKALAETEGTTIIGGGDSAAAIKQLGYADRVSHVSTGGGASLEFLEGNGLPGVDIINEK
ncbi:MAG: phosphoglycerate kinase [Erysipelotrichaceae bacterium]|nr:phosphoglycerate kinase [Erysipelotrichaceae bacterium]